MLEDLKSKLSPFSLGVVTSDAVGNIIKVCPVEEMPFLDGQIDKQDIKYEVNMPDARGVKRKSTLGGKFIIDAEWVPYSNSNRVTAPNVMKNETVMLYRYADTQKFYWNTIFNEPNIRRQETVKYAFGNKKSGLDAWDDESSYWFEASTKKKSIVLRTSKNDGEKAAYTFKIDSKDGLLFFDDEQGQIICIDTKNRRVFIKAARDIVLDASTVFVSGKLIHGGQSVGKSPSVSLGGNTYKSSTE